MCRPRRRIASASSTSWCPEGGDLREAAIAFARRVADIRPLPRIRDHDEKLAEAKADPGIFDAMRKSIARRARNQKAPYHCIAAVEAACTMPFDDGVRRERELFDELENSAEARALRYAFFAEREVARLPDIPRDTPLRPIKTAAIVGAGTMGGGIAMSFAEFGFPVKLLEVEPGGARPRPRPHPRQLRDQRQARQPQRSRDEPSARPDRTGHQL